MKLLYAAAATTMSAILLVPTLAQSEVRVPVQVHSAQAAAPAVVRA